MICLLSPNNAFERSVMRGYVRAASAQYTQALAERT